MANRGFVLEKCVSPKYIFCANCKSKVSGLCARVERFAKTKFVIGFLYLNISKERISVEWVVYRILENPKAYFDTIFIKTI